MIYNFVELLLADGGAEKSGKYLFRMKPKAPGEYLLGVVYKGAATHHAVAKVDGSFTLNKNPTQQTSLYDVNLHSFYFLLQAFGFIVPIPLYYVQ